MDIKRLVNTRHQHVQSDCWQHPHQQALPPVSSILHNHHSYPGHHYPMPPQGEGNVYYHQQHQQQVYPQQQPTYFAPPQSYQGPPPSYHQSPTSELPYPFTTANPAARTSSSALSSSSTRYAPSITSGPATSAERRSLSDGEDDADSQSDENHSGSNTPLPPYYQSQQPQQVCFTDGTVTPPSDRSNSSEPTTSDLVCDVCSVSYSRAPDLRRHKATVHNDRDSKEKVSATFPCDVCGQILLSSHGYQGHMRRHYDERPFVCEAPFCGKAFHDSATLARHRRTHSTEHKFECDFCGRRFKRKDNLNTHRKKHQTGGETINPNLLRKPVSRVNTSSGAVTPPVETTSPTSTTSSAFAEVPAFQTQIQVAPSIQLSQPVPMDVSSAVPPAYTAAMQLTPPPRQPVYQQQQPMYHAYPQQQSPITLHPSYPSYYPNTVKAEEYQHRAMYAVAPPRN